MNSEIMRKLKIKTQLELHRYMNDERCFDYFHAHDLSGYKRIHNKRRIVQRSRGDSDKVAIKLKN